MEISNNYSTAKVWNTSNKNVSKSSKKNKWKLTDSLKEKIVDLAKKDAQDNVYMGNAFMNLRKTEVSKVEPNVNKKPCKKDVFCFHAAFSEIAFSRTRNHSAESEESSGAE